MSTRNLFKYPKHLDIVQSAFFTNKTITKLEKNSIFLDLKSYIFPLKAIASALFGSPNLELASEGRAVNKVVQKIGALPLFYVRFPLDDGF